MRGKLTCSSFYTQSSDKNIIYPCFFSMNQNTQIFTRRLGGKFKVGLTVDHPSLPLTSAGVKVEVNLIVRCSSVLKCQVLSQNNVYDVEGRRNNCCGGYL